MVSLAASWLWPRILSSLRIRTCPTRTLPLSRDTFGIVQAIWLHRAVIWLITQRWSRDWRADLEEWIADSRHVVLWRVTRHDQTLHDLDQIGYSLR